MKLHGLGAGLLFAPLFLLSGQSSRVPADVLSLTPEQILARMAKTYAHCTTYRDSGAVTTVFFQERGKRTVRKPFTTAFVRPDRFRYEFQDRRGELEFDRYLIWRDGDRVRTWWDVRPGIEERDSLQRALAGATGVSGGSAQYVPGYLLREEVEPWLLPNLRDAQKIDDASIGATVCFRITGTDRAPYASSKTLWIDKQSFLLRRIEEQTQFDDFRTEKTADYEPEIDVPIAESLLVFDPPQPEER